MVADAVEPLEGEPKPPLRAEELVEVLAGHAVRPEGPFEVRLRTSLERPRSREPAQIEDVRDPGGTLPRERIAVVGGHHGVDDLRDPALGERPVDEVPIGGGAVGSGVEQRVIDRLEQPLPAGGAVVGHGHVHEVPGRYARVDLPAKLVQSAVVAVDVDPDPGRPGERLEVGLDLASLVGPAPRDHGDRPVGIGRGRRRGRGAGGVHRGPEEPRAGAGDGRGDEAGHAGGPGGGSRGGASRGGDGRGRSGASDTGVRRAGSGSPARTKEPDRPCKLHRRLAPRALRPPRSPRAVCRSSCRGKP